MNLLEYVPGVELDDDDWKIFSRNPAKPPHYMAPGSRVKNCYVTEGCEIEGDIENSIIFEGVTVEKGAKVRDSIILPCSHIGKDTVIQKAIIGSNTYISEGSEIGSVSDDAVKDFHNTKICSHDITLIGSDIVIDKGIKVAKCSMVTRNIMNSADFPNASVKVSGTATA